MDIEHISVSRLQCYRECPRKYKFKYHLKMVPEGPEPPYFAYGKTVHKIAEEYVRGGGDIPINVISQEVLSGKIPIEGTKKAPPMDAEYRRKFPLHVGQIERLTKSIGFDGKLEWKFRFDLTPGETPDPEFRKPPTNPDPDGIIRDGRFATGFIDRVIIRGDKFFILDYKTTKKGMFRKNPFTVRKDLQLRVYAQVIQREFGAKAEDIKAALFYLEGGELVATRFTDESLETAEDELRKTFIKIERQNPDEVYGWVGKQCERCDYSHICPDLRVT